MDLSRGSWCGRSLRTLALRIAMLVVVVRAQVRNLRFVDQDTDTGQIGGTIFWDKPAAGDDGYDYTVYLCADSTGSGSKTQLPLSGAYALPGGADVSAFPVPSDTAFGSNTHILVYLKSHATAAESDVASICIIDNPTGYARTVYFTTKGYTNANNARDALVTGCHASYESINVEMVATAKWTAGSVVSETDFDDTNEESTTASFMVNFPTGTAFTAIVSAITSYVSDAPVDAVYTGSGASSSYSFGVFTASSRLDAFVPDRPDPDIARYIARSCIHFDVAGAAIINRAGEVRIQTKADKQTAVQQVANVYLNTGLATTSAYYTTVTYSDMGASAYTLFDNAATSSTAQCYQVTGTDKPSCLSPYTV